MGVHARPRESAQGAQKAAVTDVIHGPLVMPTSPDLLALYQRFDRLMALADQQAELESLKKSGDPFALQLEGMLIYHRHQSPTESLFSVDELVSAVKAELPWKIASDVSSDNLVTRDVALIRERNERDNVHTVYWSPKRPNEWGSVEIRFEWNTDSNPALAIFEPSLHVFGDYDATAAGELAVSSEATGNRWVDLAALGRPATRSGAGTQLENLRDLLKVVALKKSQSNHAGEIRVDGFQFLDRFDHHG